ncbi:MAG: DEAD/DEAH box helicase [Pontiellaceae bacterium]|nr:DEAD/DEAH box helicase [Pontiellaceae bacterium]
MSLLKKIASVFGKKDEPKQKEAPKTKKQSSSEKKRQAVKPHQEEWRPGSKPQPRKTENRPKRSEGPRPPRKPKQGDRPEGEGQRPQGERKPRPMGDRKPRPQGDGENRPQGERKPRPPKPAPQRPKVDETPWDPSEFNVEPQEGKIRFHDLELHPLLMRSIHALGWQYTTPIQGEILPGTLKGKDMAGRAQTGTGKTAAFLISIINHCLNNPLQKQGIANPRALIIAPTRELAMQIKKDADGLNQFTGLRTVVLYGGMDYNKQERELADGPVDIVVATPGRLLDFENKNVLRLHYVEIMVIDEADRMLDMGFIPDVRRIIYKTPPKEKRQTVLFSATLSDEVMRLAAAWMTDPVRIDIEPEQVAVNTVEQKVYIATDDQKFQLLYNIIKHDKPERIIVFTNRRDQAERLSEALDRYGHKCEMLSGAVTQKKRMRILEEFREGKVTVLVATDVAGRGIHVEGVSHVVNFNIPENPDDYVHRIGRTGRAGATGQSITFACEMESFELPKIEELLGVELKCSMPPEELLEDLPPAPPRKRRPRPEGEGGRPRHQNGRRPSHGGGNNRKGDGPRRGGGSRPPRQKPEGQ